jgi:hypothetical protein
MRIAAAGTVGDDVESQANSRRKGKSLQSQRVIEYWVQLYNCVTAASYRVKTPWCTERSEAESSVVCEGPEGRLIALEHAHIEMRNEEVGARCLVTGSSQPGTRLIGNTLETKLLKLSVANADKRILVLESDSVTGSIEDLYARVRDEVRIRSLRSGVDEIWAVLTAILDSENLIFTNRIDPEDGDDGSLCSLNVITGEFWRLRR